eukprot:m.360338 g.360338  ORF g.360338 m.360338 type:complete len:67 (-) comp16639_c0_seq5:81-281(-)
MPACVGTRQDQTRRNEAGVTGLGKCSWRIMPNSPTPHTLVNSTAPSGSFFVNLLFPQGEVEMKFSE